MTENKPPVNAGTREWIGLAVIAVPCLLYSMDLTVLYLAVPQISEALRPSASELLWMVDIYGFMVAGWLITMGTLGDRIGRRRLLLIGATAFGIASVFAAYAPTAQMLIVARALQGIAAATLAPSTLSLIRNMFLNDRERSFAIGVWVASFSAGAVLGPVLGGLILSHFWWGAVFLINVPMMLLLLVLGPLLLPEYKDPQAGRMDVPSALLSLGGVLLVIYGMKRIAEDGWAPIHAFAIAAGIAVGVLFVRRQRGLADPLIDVGMFRSRTFSAALGVNVLGLFTVLGSFLFIAQYLQLVLGMTPLEAGIWTAPSGIAFVAGSMGAPFLLRVATPATILVTGFLISAAGYAIVTQLSIGHGPWLLFAGMMVFCVGLSPIGAITTDLVMAQVSPEKAGAASGISETSFEFGGATGIAVLGSILTAIYGSRVRELTPPDIPAEAVDAASGTLAAALDAARALPSVTGDGLLVAAREAFVDAMALTSMFAAVAAVGAAVMAAVFLRTRNQSV